MWIHELNRELTGRPLEIWVGKKADGTPIDMPEPKRQAYMQKLRMQSRGLTPSQPPKPPLMSPKARPCGCNKKK